MCEACQVLGARTKSAMTELKKNVSARWWGMEEVRSGERKYMENTEKGS